MNLNYIYVTVQHIDPPISVCQPSSSIRFLATGSFYHCVGDMHGPSKATICRVIRKVTHLINEQLIGAIRWPTTPDQKAMLNQGFYEVADMPNVIGGFMMRKSWAAYIPLTDCLGLVNS